jgi:methionyl-tRNA formyltransferase
VLASFGIIIPKEVLEMFSLGIINVHPSLLPQYRGPTPGQTAILNGDKVTGVSIMKLDEEIDHGPILVQEKTEIEPPDTSASLYKRLFEQGAKILGEALPKYITGKLKLKDQDHSKATFTDHLIRDSGFVDINKPPSKETLKRMIRAFYPWPGVWVKTKLNGQEKIIKLLPEGKIKVEGKNVMSLRDFANGYPEGGLVLEKLSLY